MVDLHRPLLRFSRFWAFVAASTDQTMNRRELRRSPESSRDLTVPAEHWVVSHAWLGRGVLTGDRSPKWPPEKLTALGCDGPAAFDLRTRQHCQRELLAPAFPGRVPGIDDDSPANLS